MYNNFTKSSPTIYYKHQLLNSALVFTTKVLPGVIENSKCPLLSTTLLASNSTNQPTISYKLATNSAGFLIVVITKTSTTTNIVIIIVIFVTIITKVTTNVSIIVSIMEYYQSIIVAIFKDFRLFNLTMPTINAIGIL